MSRPLQFHADTVPCSKGDKLGVGICPSCENIHVLIEKPDGRQHIVTMTEEAASRFVWLVEDAVIRNKARR